MKWEARLAEKWTIIIMGLAIVVFIILGIFVGFPSFMLPLLAIIWLFRLPRHFISFVITKGELILRTALFYKKRIALDQIELIYSNYYGSNQMVINYGKHKYVILYPHKNERQSFIDALQEENTSIMIQETP